jgi:hypothetical protein
METIQSLEKENRNLKEGLRHSDEMIFSLSLSKEDFMKRC